MTVTLLGMTVVSKVNLSVDVHSALQLIWVSMIAFELQQHLVETHEKTAVEVLSRSLQFWSLVPSE